jgi:hypothetical protein
MDGTGQRLAVNHSNRSNSVMAQLKLRYNDHQSAVLLYDFGLQENARAEFKSAGSLCAGSFRPLA